MKRKLTTTFCPIAATILICWSSLNPAAEAGDQAPAPPVDSAEFPRYVMNKIDDLYRGAKSHGIMEMQVKTKNWTRTISLESWSLGKQYSLVRILKPKKEKGTATLKAGGDLFTYLSKTGRTIKITSGMMGASWMGSHFTNDDLIRHTRFENDFDIKLASSGKIGRTDVYHFDLIPKPDAPVVWGKITVTVRRSDLQPLRQDYFDEDGRKVRTMTLSKHSPVGNRTIPLEMEMKPLDAPGEFTKITWKKADFSVNINKGFFTIQKLKSM